jgi:transposase
VGRNTGPTKVEELKRCGAFNANSKSVIDANFVDEKLEFFDPRDLVQVKYEMLRTVSADGRTVTEAAAQAGLSKPSFYKARADFDVGGLAGLIPRKRGPKGPHKLRDALVDEVLGLRDGDLPLSAAEIVDAVAERFGVRVHVRTVERALSRREKKRRLP